MLTTCSNFLATIVVTAICFLLHRFPGLLLTDSMDGHDRILGLSLTIKRSYIDFERYSNRKSGGGDGRGLVNIVRDMNC